MCVQAKIFGLWNHFVSAEVVKLAEGEFLGMKGFGPLATKPNIG